MLTYEELKRINAERRKEYEMFKARHQKIMNELDQKEKRLNDEYNHLKNLIYGITIKMTVK